MLPIESVNGSRIRVSKPPGAFRSPGPRQALASLEIDDTRESSKSGRFGTADHPVGGESGENQVGSTRTHDDIVHAFGANASRGRSLLAS
jgi:hypothetical protein